MRLTSPNTAGVPYLTNGPYVRSGMRKLISIFALVLFLGALNSMNSRVYAQAGPPEIAGALSRLKNNPRYQGRILGTHVKRNAGRYLYEVRILRPDDRVILVYIDPQTGGVVGDSDRRKQRRAISPDRRDRLFGRGGANKRGRNNQNIRRGFAR